MKKGFTLAEVLLALAIIGIIAATTLPGLRTRMQERRTAALYTKYCNIMDAAVGQLFVDRSLTSATLAAAVTTFNLTPYLQVDTTTHTFKDGTSFSATNGVITMTFPADTHVESTTYTVDGNYEGINCSTVINAQNAIINPTEQQQ